MTAQRSRARPQKADERGEDSGDKDARHQAVALQGLSGERATRGRAGRDQLKDFRATDAEQPPPGDNTRLCPAGTLASGPHTDPRELRNGGDGSVGDGKGGEHGGRNRRSQSPLPASFEPARRPQRKWGEGRARRPPRRRDPAAKTPQPIRDCSAH